MELPKVSQTWKVHSRRSRSPNKPQGDVNDLEQGPQLVCVEAQEIIVNESHNDELFGGSTSLKRQQGAPTRIPG